MKREEARFSTILGIVCMLAVLMSIVPCAAQTEIIVLYDGESGEFPEGIAVDKQGNVFVGISLLGAIDKITPDGNVEQFALLDPAVPFFGVLGLAVDAPGNVYSALMSMNPDTHGVWRVSSDGQSQELLPGTGDITFPNSLAFDKVGNLYVTDSWGGAIWRIPPGGVAEVWVQDDLLAADEPGCGIGANGIAYRHREIFVANTCESLILRFQVEQDGSAGAPEIILDGTVQDPFFLFWPDGLALDVHGMIYTVNYLMNQLVRVSPEEGTFEILASFADGDPIDEPAALAFGTGKGERKSLFITNFARFGIPPQPPVSIGTSVVKIPVDTQGLPLP